MSSWLHDFRFAFRSLVKSPGFAAVAVLTLALGIGANSAIFSVVNGVVLKPLEYRAPERLVYIISQFPTMGFDKFWVSAPEYLEFREWNSSFEEVALYNTGQSSIHGSEQPLRVLSINASASLFDVLGVEAFHGRVFTADEDVPGAPPVVLLSYELWQRAFGADPTVVGSLVEVDGTERTVVGVAPPRFDIDDNRAELWLPLGLDTADPPGRAGHNYRVVGRLKDGVGLGQARADLSTLLTRWEQEGAGQHSPSAENHPLKMYSLHDEVVGETSPKLWMLLGAVGFVLLVACANVANLLLAKAESRQKEIAIRSAIGAGRTRLMRQFLVESITLASLGGVLGLLLAFWGVRLILATNPGSVPRSNEIFLDGNVLAFTFVVTIVTGLLFGMTPLMHLTKRSMGAALKEGGQRSTSGSARQRLRRGLVVAEIALAVVLVVGSGLMLRSFFAMQQVDPGFRPDGLSTFQLYLPESGYPDPEAQVGFFRDLSTRITAIPGIEAASAMSGLPPRRRINANDMEFEGVEQDPDGPPHNVDYWQFVTDGYFETMGIPLVTGRVFRPSDDGEATPVAIINETTARVFWPDQDPLGRRLKPPSDRIPWFTVVGIVKDVKQGGLEEDTGTEVYFYYPQTAAAMGFAPRGMNIVIRSSLPPASVAEAAREQVWSRDASLPLANLRSMPSVLSDSLASPRFLTVLLVIFGAVALALAAVGTYGVMSYSVAERTSEIGIRMALGAGTGRVLEMVLSQAAVLTGFGLALGLMLAVALTRLLSSLTSSILFGVDQTDLVTFVSVPLVLLLVALLATVIPAYRAMRVQPVRALRYE